jgi:type IV pilus assembly protein PilO
MAILDKIEGIPAIQRAGILALVVLLIIGGYWQLSYKKKQIRIKVLQGQLSKLNTELQNLRAIEKKLPEFKSMIVDLQDQLSVARAQLPLEKEIPKLLKDISDFGKKSGMEFISFRPGTERPKGFYTEVPMTLAIKGPFHNLAGFLDEISHYKRIIKVSNLSIGGAVEKEGYVVVRSTAQATTYRYVEQSAN